MSSIDILVPELPESVSDATIAVWHKQAGDTVQRDEILVEIETDKIVLEVPATESGILVEMLQEEGSTVLSKQLIGRLQPADLSGKLVPEIKSSVEVSTPEPAKAGSVETLVEGNNTLGPGVRRLLSEYELDPAEIKATSSDGRISKEDIERYLTNKVQTPPKYEAATTSTQVEAWVRQAHRSQKRVPMTRLRKRIAERLLDAKNSTAMLTTFNEVNMQPVKVLRTKYGEVFEKRHGVRLGLMSFYVKAVLEALKRYPEINASIDGDDIVYHNYFDLSIAVSTPRGLVTPILRDVDALGMADIEKAIRELALKGREGKLTVEDLTGGNFTITNGGVFGSLMSTPIINPPQSAILGVHAINDRPMAVDGQVVILPMMYIALSYDHRIVDGREAVGFLVTVKEMLEDPNRLLLDV